MASFDIVQTVLSTTILPHREYYFSQKVAFARCNFSYACSKA